MHFFTEVSKLKNQLNLDDPSKSKESYGPIGMLSEKFNIASLFALKDGIKEAKAFACQKSMMLVQTVFPEGPPPGDGEEDTRLVNVALKPLDGLDIPFQSIKYYIYRGIKRSSLLTHDPMVPDGIGVIREEDPDQPELNSDFIKKISGAVALAGIAPTPLESLGFDAVLSDMELLDEVFNGKIPGLKLSVLEEGEWFADFSQNLGFEIILEDKHNGFDAAHPDLLRFDLAYLRKTEHVVDISTIALDVALNDDEKHFKTRIRREEILSFIDSAAFFGMHYEQGVKVTTFDDSGRITTTEKKQKIFTEILAAYTSRDRVYLDIRSDLGFSYNFYGNYELPASTFLLKMKYGNLDDFENAEYPTSNWPIYFTSFWQGTGNMNRIKFKLRMGTENPNPLLFFENPNLLSGNKKEQFMFWKNLPSPALPEWTEEITIKIPQIENADPDKSSFPNYIRIYYFRQEIYSGAFGQAVPQLNAMADSAFGSVQYANAAISNGTFGNYKSTSPQLVRNSDFRYITYPEVYVDAASVLYYSENYKTINGTKKKFPKKVLFSDAIVSSPVFPKTASFHKTKLTENTGTLAVPALSEFYVLNSTNFKKTNPGSTKKEDLFVLGITPGEQVLIESLILTLSLSHPQKFLFVEQGSGFTDFMGTPFRRYKLFVHGLNGSGLVEVIDTTLIVNTVDNFIFSTVNFATAAVVSENVVDPLHLQQWNDVGSYHYTNKDGIGAVQVGDKFNGLLPGLNSTPEIILNARVFYPADAPGNIYPAFVPSARQADYPTVVMIHGNGHDYLTYDALLTHLAKNGFIAVSIDVRILDGPAFKHGMAAKGRANALFKHLVELKRDFGASMSDNIGIMGHSRGGEGVVTAARLIGASAARNFNIKAIFSLAPTDQYEAENAPANIPFFVLYGSRDGDVNEMSFDDRPIIDPGLVLVKMTYGTGFSLWDRALSETKSMAFVYRATHNGFVTTNANDYRRVAPAAIPALDLAPEAMQQNILSAYANAFFGVHLKNMEAWKILLSGDGIPPSIVDKNTPIYPQYKHKRAERRDLTDFEGARDIDGGVDGTLKLRLIEPFVPPGGGVDVTADKYSPHSTQAIQIDIAKNAEYRVPLPAALDASNFAFLSFRVSKKFRTPTDLSSMKVVLSSTGVPDSEQLPSVIIPDPDLRTKDPELSKSAMRTVRMPLANFPGLNQRRITGVKLVFGVAAGIIELDDFAFTN